MTFTEDQQRPLRAHFITECHQKAWGAACNADYIAKEIDDLTAEAAKIQERDRKLEEEIKTLKSAFD